VWDIEAKDDVEVIGRGTHERFAVDFAKFNARVAKRPRGRRRRQGSPLPAGRGESRAPPADSSSPGNLPGEAPSCLPIGKSPLTRVRPPVYLPVGKYQCGRRQDGETADGEKGAEGGRAGGEVRERLLAGDGAVRLERVRVHDRPEIVERAGVDQAGPLYYFRSKEGISQADAGASASSPRSSRETSFTEVRRGSGCSVCACARTTSFVEHIDAARVMYAIYYGPPQGARSSTSTRTTALPGGCSRSCGKGSGTRSSGE